jgi:hypothetical protein
MRLYRMTKREQKSGKVLKRVGAETAAFVDPANSEVIVIVELPDVDEDPMWFYRIINHETLHVAFHRVGISNRINLAFDRFVLARGNRCLVDHQWECELIFLGM